MMKCMACGNTEVFREPQIEWQKVTYDADGNVVDAEHIAYEAFIGDYDDDDYPVECGKCGKTEVDHYFEPTNKVDSAPTGTL